MKTNENFKNVKNSIKLFEKYKKFKKMNDFEIKKFLKKDVCVKEKLNDSFMSQETQRITILDAETLAKLNKIENDRKINKVEENNLNQQNQYEFINNENSQNNPNNIQNKFQKMQEQAKQTQNNFQDKKDYRLEKMLFNRINVMQGKIKESLELIKKFERINAKEENLPNIITTLHDKLIQEVIKQLRTVGIEFNMNSFLVQSIVSDLLNKFGEGITEFKDCSENLNFVREVQEDFEARTEIAPTSKVKNIFAKLRGMFKPERKQERLEQLERERQEEKLEKANIHLIKYKFINSELAKYTIKNNIVESLTREMMNSLDVKPNKAINEFISERISPEMIKLGLSNLIPVLEENLYISYTKKHHISQLDKNEFLNMEVAKLKRGRTFKDMKDTENNINSDEERIAV